MTIAAAGVAASVFQVMGIVGALGAPLLLIRLRPLVVLVLLCCCWLAVPLGFLLAPQAWLVWTVLGGVAQGGTLVAIFTLLVLRSPSPAQTRGLSSIVQTGGYGLACLGPSVLGGVHDAAASWDAPLVVVLVLVVVLAVLGAGACLGLPSPRRPRART
jgi:CP family cyanate transporter-like MFS transporter